MTDIPAIARGLSEADKALVLAGKWNVDPLCGELLIAGAVKRMPTVSWPYYVELTPLGLAVRQYLQEQSR